MTICLAIDIGGTKIAAALIEGTTLVERRQVPTPGSKQPQALTAALSELVHPLLERADYVAVASTGIISDGVLMALNPDNLGGLNNYPLKATLETLTSLPCYVLNDAQAACWSEYQRYAEQKLDMAFITISTGVGAGVVLNGQLLVGRRGIAGHAGHIQADPNGPVCGCGRVGCVEAIASGTAIAKAGQALWGADCCGKRVHDEWQNGSKQALAIFEKSAQAVAQMIADLRISLDLDVVVLGGSVGLADGYLELVQKEINNNPEVYRPTITQAQAGNDAGLIGAALWSQQYFNNEF